MSEFALGEAALGTAVDMGGLNKGIDDANSMVKGGFGKIGDIISGAFKIGIAGAITGIVALGVAVKGGIDDARASVQLMAETETIIKNTGGAAGITAKQVADLATSLSDAEGKSLFGDDQIQGAENVLLRYKELKGIIPRCDPALRRYGAKLRHGTRRCREDFGPCAPEAVRRGSQACETGHRPDRRAKHDAREFQGNR